jgi:hypothetical protein
VSIGTQELDYAISSSFRDGPKDETTGAKLRNGESRDSGFASSKRPGMMGGRIRRRHHHVRPTLVMQRP